MSKKEILKGTYCILIELKDNTVIKIGKLEKLKFKKGYYVYVGSALNSLNGRIKRHIRDDKKLHWHIDYFLANNSTEIINVIYSTNEDKMECKLAYIIADRSIEIKDFGCSDCKCDSHLFYFENFLDLEKNCYYAFEKLDLNPKKYSLEY